MLPNVLIAQVENVPVENQVYDFLDRMAVKGVLPLYSNVMIPISRQETSELLKAIEAKQDRLNDAEIAFLHKFEQEFMHEIDPAREENAVVFRDGLTGELLSDKEKYLYEYSDSSASLYLEFLGSLEYRRISGDSFGSTHSSLEQHGGRIRGTLKNKMGFFLEGTNGTLFGDHAFALSDPRLRGNVKFNDLNTPYFDFTQAYLRADLSWFNVEFGREYTLVGTGYSDRLLLSRNAPAFDFLKLDARYKSIRFLFLHGRIVNDSASFPGLIVQEPVGSTKYLSLHRVQLSLFDRLNIGLSEMTIYQRFSPEFAYLNPIIFYKSVEHSLHDRDNSFLNLDLEVFPFPDYKLYGTLLVDDIDFSKIGTGWWGNELGWQGGVTTTEVAGIPNLDATLEYARIEPYVYSNRVEGNDYTNDNISLGHHLPPNSDEWFLQLGYRPTKSLRAWASYTGSRHGENIYEAGGQLVKNVGGNALEGHRGIDSDNVHFLDGNVVQSQRLQLRTTFEPITNLFLSATYEYRKTKNDAANTEATDHYGAMKAWVEW